MLTSSAEPARDGGERRSGRPSRFRVSGRGLDRRGTRPGQFFFCGSCCRASGTRSIPSRSPSPEGNSSGSRSRISRSHGQVDRIKVGTRVITRPVRRLHRRARSRDKALLIAGGSGITPVRACSKRWTATSSALPRGVHRGHRLLDRSSPSSRAARCPDRLRGRGSRDRRGPRSASSRAPQRARPGSRRPRGLPVRPTRR